MSRLTWKRVVVLACVAIPAHAQTAGPAIAVDIAAGHHPISPDIYGMASSGVTPAYQAAARLPVLRWGGDAATRYNWHGG